MSKDKSKNTAPVAEGSDFDYSNLLPEGFDAGELQKTGGLTPIFSPKECQAAGAVIVIGVLKWIERLPEVQMGRETFEPYVARVKVTNATKGTVGKKADRQIVDVPAGEDILMPLSGNLSNNKKLLDVLRDRETTRLAVFRLVGQKDIGQVSPMWEYDVRIHPKVIERKADLIMIDAPIAPPSLASSNGAAASSETY